MKKIFSALAVIVMIALSKNSGAQSKSDVAFNSAPYAVNMPLKSPDKKTFETKVTEVNIKAVSSYKSASDVRWFKTEGGFIANFLSRGVDTRIVYSNKGNWLYNLLTYMEDNMAYDIRKMVKSNYYDYDIAVVFEYKLHNGTVYIIRMRDESKGLKILRISDGEMEEIHNDHNN